MMDAVQMMISEHGEEGIINTPTGAESKNYSPSSPTDFGPASQGNPGTTVVGAYTKGTESGLSSEFAGLFLIETLPAGVSEGKSMLRLARGNFIIAKIRHRSFAGQTNGYELHLKG